jgi:indole-3-glycerol phosphate synthase
MTTILDEILARKRVEVAEARQRISDDALAERANGIRDSTRGFRAALTSAERPRAIARAALISAERPRVIAEVKRRSPSRGEIRADFDPVACGRAYAAAGAAAISVLTDEHYFGGHLDFLTALRSAVPIPLLRKDFVVDAYQIDEARVAGADAVLLIASALDEREISRLREHALARDLDVLVEVHEERELQQALAAGADLIGINNRDLRSFEVDLAVTEKLASRLPEDVVVVAESGIFTPDDVARLETAGADAFLVGESLMREPDIGLALRRLRRTS